MPESLQAPGNAAGALAGGPLPRIAGAVEMPIFQSATYTMPARAATTTWGLCAATDTPSQLALHAKLALLEGAEAALVRRAAWRAVPRERCSALLYDRRSHARAKLPVQRHAGLPSQEFQATVSRGTSSTRTAGVLGVRS